MSFRLTKSETLPDGVRRVCREQLECAVAEIDSDAISNAKKVHQVRKRLKKVRGALRILRPACGKLYQDENAALRDAARRVAEYRDSKVLLSTYDRLMEHYSNQIDRSAYGSIRRQLTARRKRLLSEGDSVRVRLEEVRGELSGAAERLPNWSIDEASEQSLEAGLKKTYKRARRRLESVAETPCADQFHQLRKRVKYHWHHLSLLRRTWSRVVRARRSEAKRLSDLLGDEHDLAVLKDAVRSQPDEFGSQRDVDAFAGLIEARQSQLRRRALLLSHRLCSEKPAHLAGRLTGYWRLWRES